MSKKIHIEAEKRLVQALKWIADAPSFIDSDAVSRFFDAIVQPAGAKAEWKKTAQQDLEKELSGTVAGKGTLKIGNWLTDLVVGLKAEAELGAEGTASRTKTDTVGAEVIYKAIDTSQRQLVQLAIYYMTRLPERIRFANSNADKEWRDSARILESPRLVAFVDLAGNMNSVSGSIPFQVIPTAAEFADGQIEPFYQSLKAKNDDTPPPYPEDPEKSAKELVEERKKYWAWFSSNISPTTCLRAVEEAASKHGKILWIDYRLPLNADGETLHLHCCPAGQYDTGTFAYQFIKRGSKHGMRLIGTMKSEPAMNVLAIYEK